MPATATETLKLSKIETEDAIQPRAGGLNAEHVDGMAEVYRRVKAGEIDNPIPAPVVWKVGKRYILTQGFHRRAAAAKAGLTELEVEVRAGEMAAAAIDALTSNREHTALFRTNDDKRRAVLELQKWLPPNQSSGSIADLLGVSREFVERLLEKHFPERSKQTTRVDKGGKERKVTSRKGATVAPPKMPTGVTMPDGTVVSIHVGDDGEETVLPPAGTDGPVEKKGEYPPDARFMPNAEDAGKVVAEFKNWKARLEAVRSEMRRRFPERGCVPADRIDFHGQFQAYLGDLITTLGENLPEYTCPACAGTGDDGGNACQACDGYGMVSATGADSNKRRWQKTGDVYADLCKQADYAEALGE